MDDNELYEFAVFIIDLRKMKEEFDLEKVIQGLKSILKKRKENKMIKSN